MTTGETSKSGEGSEAVGTDDQPEAGLYVPLKGESAIDYIAIKTEQLVTEKLAKREAKYHRNMSLVFSLAGLVGLGAITTIVHLTMDQTIDTHVKSELANVEVELQKRFAEAEDGLQRLLAESENRIAKNAELVRNTVALQKLALTVEAAEEKGDIDSSELEDILTRIEHLAGSEEIVAEDQFATILEKIVATMAAKGSLASIGRLDRSLRPVLLENKPAAIKLGNYLSYILVSEVVPPDEQTEEMRRALAYLDQSRRFGYPENYLFWNLMIELKNNGLAANKRTDRLIESASALSNTDLKYFVRKIDTYLEVQDETNRREREAAVVANALASSYANELEALRTALPAEEDKVQDGTE